MYKIRKANEKELKTILNIYNSLIGTPGCTWNLEYPNIEDVKQDYNNNSLYVITYNNEIIGAAAAGCSDEIKHLTCWNKKIKNPCDLARIGIKQQYQGKGIAKILLKYIEEDVKNKFDGIHFIVSKTNPKALALYNSMNYKNVGEIYIYYNDWYCYEKKL